MDNDYLIGFVLVAGVILAGYGWNQGWFQSILSGLNGSPSPGGDSGNGDTYPDMNSPDTPLPSIDPVFNPRDPVMVVDPVAGIESPVNGGPSFESSPGEIQKKSASQVMSHFLRDLPYDPAYDWNDDGEINSTDSSLAFKAL